MTRQKPSAKGYMTTSFFANPEDWQQFKLIADAESTSVAALLRALIRREVRRAIKAGVLAT